MHDSRLHLLSVSLLGVLYSREVVMWT